MDKKVNLLEFPLKTTMKNYMVKGDVFVCKSVPGHLMFITLSPLRLSIVLNKGTPSIEINSSMV